MRDPLHGARIGLAMTGSFCTFERVFEQLSALTRAGAILIPILSTAAANTDTRFYPAAEIRRILTDLCGRAPLLTIADVEPIGPNGLLDLLLIAPCTGNTCAKLAHGIADTPVTLACKSHLRNERPVVIAISSNDALGANAANIGSLLSRRHFYFVPLGQDDPVGKPRSAVFEAAHIADTCRYALGGQQIQPILILNKNRG